MTIALLTESVLNAIKRIPLFMLISAGAVPIVHGATYSTNFPATENPIFGGGAWINGGVVGLDWSNVQSIDGHASGTQIDASNGTYNDSTAVLSGLWGPDQSAQATVIAGNNWQSSIEEVELRLRTSIGPHSITGYEFDFRVASPGGYVAIVRWNGPLNDFSSLGGQLDTYQGIKQGDVILCTAIGNTLSAYVNGVLVAQVTDSTFSDGSPGVGFWMSGAGDNASFGLMNFSTTDGGSPILPPVPPPNAPYATWEAKLLNELGSLGIGPSRVHTVGNWLSNNPPVP